MRYSSTLSRSMVPVDFGNYPYGFLDQINIRRTNGTATNSRQGQQLQKIILNNCLKQRELLEYQQQKFKSQYRRPHNRAKSLSTTHKNFTKKYQQNNYHKLFDRMEPVFKVSAIQQKIAKNKQKSFQNVQEDKQLFQQKSREQIQIEYLKQQVQQNNKIIIDLQFCQYELHSLNSDPSTKKIISILIDLISKSINSTQRRSLNSNIRSNFQKQQSKYYLQEGDFTLSMSRLQNGCALQPQKKVLQSKYNDAEELDFQVVPEQKGQNHQKHRDNQMNFKVLETILFYSLLRINIICLANYLIYIIFIQLIGQVLPGQTKVRKTMAAQYILSIKP